MIGQRPKALALCFRLGKRMLGLVACGRRDDDRGRQNERERRPCSSGDLLTVF